MESGIFVGLVFYYVFGAVFHYIAHSGLELAVLPRLYSNYPSPCLTLQYTLLSYKHGSLPKSPRYVGCWRVSSDVVLHPCLAWAVCLQG